jgi:hypothetical protein
MSTPENASPTAPRRGRRRAYERVARLNATAALERVARPPLLADGADPVYLASAVTIVEHPDRDGVRWLAALTLLIEAGRTAENEERG